MSITQVAITSKQVQITRLPTTISTDELTTRVIADGVCRGADDDPWFPVPMSKAKARQACGDCWVQAACLELALREEAALARPKIQGVRGGLTPASRYELIQARSTEAAPADENTSTGVAA